MFTALDIHLSIVSPIILFVQLLYEGVISNFILNSILRIDIYIHILIKEKNSLATKNSFVLYI